MCTSIVEVVGAAAEIEESARLRKG